MTTCLVLLMYFGTVTEARVSGTEGVEAHVRGLTWPTGFCDVYEVDGDTCSDVTVDFATTAVEVASKQVAHSGPNAAAKKEILNSSEARACPLPLQTSEDTAPIISRMACMEKLRPNAGKKPVLPISFDLKALFKGGGLNASDYYATHGVANSVANSLHSSTELTLCKRRKMLECPMDVADSVLPLVLRPHVCRPVLLLALACLHIVCVRVCACVCGWVCACTHTQTHTHRHTHTHTDTHTDTDTDTDTHTHRHTHMYIYNVGTHFPIVL